MGFGIGQILIMLIVLGGFVGLGVALVLGLRSKK